MVGEPRFLGILGAQSRFKKVPNQMVTPTPRGFPIGLSPRFTPQWSD